MLRQPDISPLKREKNMFGIGLPELIVILAVGLIVVGPEKMPELARSLAKGIVELKKAAGALKESLHEDDTTLEPDKVSDDITKAFQSLPPGAFNRDKEPSAGQQEIDISDPDEEQTVEQQENDAGGEEEADKSA